jgi:hypothetical protein
MPLLNAGALVLVAALASCSGTDKPPPPPGITSNLDAGDGIDATTPTGGNDSSTMPPPLVDAEPTSEASADGTTTDAAPEASPVRPTGCVAADPDATDVAPMMCNGKCVDLNSDPKNCGACSQPCNLTGEVCILGMCLCPAPQTACGNQCVDLNTDSSNCGSCGHNCENNPCDMGVCQASMIAQVTAGSLVLQWFAVDSSAVYWTQGTGSPPGVYFKAIAGNMMPNLLGITDDPRGVVVDLNYVYWVDYTDGSVNRSSLVGGSASQIALLPALDDSGATPGPLALAVDGQNVYWVDFEGGTINMTSKSPGGAATQLASGRVKPRAIAVDATSIYWIDYGSLANTGSVNKMAIVSSDAAPPPVVQLATGEDQPWDLAVDKTSVYWTNGVNQSGTVKSVSINGGTVHTLVQNQAAPHGIAVDSQYVYWTNYDGNTVVKAALTGGSVFAIASGQNSPEAIAVDDSSVYWANEANGTILKVAK